MSRPARPVATTTRHCRCCSKHICTILRKEQDSALPTWNSKTRRTWTPTCRHHRPRQLYSPVVGNKPAGTFGVVSCCLNNALRDTDSHLSCGLPNGTSFLDSAEHVVSSNLKGLADETSSQAFKLALADAEAIDHGLEAASISSSSVYLAHGVALTFMLFCFSFHAS
jgi:hypothetical protein